MIAFRSRAVIVAAVLGLLASAGTGEGQAGGDPPAVAANGDTVTAVPGAGYAAGGLARRLLGSGWRELWLTPVDVPVFDLGSFAGGVKWEKRGGGFQSITLHLEQEDGWREYIFRSVDKFPEIQAMPPAIRGTPAGAIIQDQVSTLFPAAPLLVPPLLEAIAALHVVPELYVMPDDPRLGIYQDTFAGMLGTVELKPNEAPDDEPGFAGSRKIKGTEEFLNDLEDSGEHRLDEREFLAVRLIDFLINDSDRTTDNFRWARFGNDGAYRWRPLPRDRDRAFMDARGWLNRFVMRPVYPKLVEFGREYSLEGLTYTSHILDRRVLQRLTRSDFEQVALRVQRSIDDEAIEAVIAALPPAWRERTDASDRLRRVLKARRAGLPAIALEFYRDLAGEVDIHGTGEAEHVEVVRHADGRVTVAVTSSDEDERVADWYRRTFLPAETNEIRLYLGGGDDLAIIRGAPADAITVRVIGGAGDDVLADSAGGGATSFYDSDGDNRFVTADGTGVSLRAWSPPEPAGGLRLGQSWSPDWGGTIGWGPVIDYGEGAGLILGLRRASRSYGFRRLPHHWEAGGEVVVGSGNGRLGAAVDADYRAENSPLAFSLAARATQLEAIRFHGYGNDSPAADPDLTLVEQNHVAVEPALVWHIGWRAREGLASPLRGQGGVVPGLRPLVGRLEAGPVLYWTEPEPRAGSPLVAASVPGADAFGRVGLRLGLELDRTDQDAVPARGWRVWAGLAGYPPLWDATRSFSTAAAAASLYLPLPGDGPHLALRAGTGLASGEFPVQHAPAIGGRTTLRGYRWQRYTGDTSTYGSAELRVPAGSVSLFVRWQLGVFGLADIGRVWFDGRSDGGWHTGFGGGFWLSALGQAFSVAFAHGEQNRWYIQRGVSF